MNRIKLYIYCNLVIWLPCKIDSFFYKILSYKELCFVLEELKRKNSELQKELEDMFEQAKE